MEKGEGSERGSETWSPVGDSPSSHDLVSVYLGKAV